MQISEYVGKVVTFKLTSGEEVVAKILGIEGNLVVIHDPVSVAPGPQGLGLMASMFTANPKAETRLNLNNVTIYALTDESVKAKYIEATTGLVVPDKKLILG
jgi:hypothetical protein